MSSYVELIAAKRDGNELRPAQIQSLINGFMAGEVADYQMTAFLMAVFLRGMSDTETVALTEAMLHSGDVLDLSSVPGIKVDKHSTGGVGDKVSLALVPIVAACDVPVPMVSGRGLGHTGGTLDKLEAIPGFNVNLDIDRFRQTILQVGGCMIGQTKQVAPADKRIYALRDVTATVESIPLITASILSKKLAEGINALVLDVKVGRGAFMKTLPQARALAESLVRVGTQAGKKVVALLTRMDDPLGRTVGNALETREAIDILFDRAPSDVTACTKALAAEMLLLGGQATNQTDANAKVDAVIQNGEAAKRMEQLIKLQDGDPRVVQDTSLLPQAPLQISVPAPSSGFVQGIDSLELGLSGVEIGAGRTRADQKVDPAVGIVLDLHVGDRVQRGQPLAHLHVQNQKQASLVLDRVTQAFELGPDQPERTDLIIDRIEA